MNSSYRTWSGPSVDVTDREIWALQGPRKGLWRMFWLALGLFTLLQLTACQQAPQGQPDPYAQAMQDPREQLRAACDLYSAGMAAATTALQQGKLNSGTIERIDITRQQIGPVCADQVHQDPARVLLAVQNAASMLAATVGSN